MVARRTRGGAAHQGEGRETSFPRTGLAHLGDYETTLFSRHSHNRMYGEMLVKGEKFQKLAEGVMTAAAMKKLGEKYNVELPITVAGVRGVFSTIKRWTVPAWEHDLELFSRYRIRVLI